MKKADFILIGAAALVIAVLLIFLYGVNTGSGVYVNIEVDGRVIETLPLSSDAVREIETDGGINVLEIKDGEAVMSSADCPDGVCVAHKAISKSGESIICLPHKVVVSVSDKDGTAEIDAAA